MLNKAKVIFRFGLNLFILTAVLLSQIHLSGIFLYPDASDGIFTNVAEAADSDPWYDSGWLYRKEIIVSGSTVNLTDYQVKQTISYETGKMNADFSDLRFVSAAGTDLYDYYIESKTDSVSASVWIKIPSISTSGMYFFMYYGNSAASSLGDKDATLDKWTQTSDEAFRQGTISDTLVRSDEVNLDVGINWTSQSAWIPTVYLYTTLDIADLDGDGDGDAMVGNDFGLNSAYRNIGTAASPSWERMESWDAPDTGSNAVPSFADLDGDGDEDLIIGATNGYSYGYRNTGSAASPVWTSEAAWTLPDVGSNSYPNLADLDNDGDFDVLVGNYIGTVTAYKNTGSAASPIWTSEAAWSLPDIGSYVNISFGDTDGDGDYDLYALDIAYKNTGNATSPVWTLDAALNAPSVGYGDDPAFYDLDNDGDLDVIMGERYGGTHAYMNTGTTAAPVWTRTTAWDILDTNYYLDPAFADLDGDGDNDLLLGNRDGATNAYENTGSSANPIWTRNGSWDAPNTGSQASPDLIDIDMDGDFDLFVGENSGIIYAYENVGNTAAPSWSARAGWNSVDTGRSPIPCFADMDGDGDYDFMVGDYDGYTRGYRNTGTVFSPVWQRYASWDMPDEGIEAGVVLLDLDNDGDYDAMVGNSGGTAHAYRNSGDVNTPSWEREDLWDAPDAGNLSTFDAIDFEGDGDADIMAGYQYAERRAFVNSAYYLTVGNFVSSSFDAGSLIKPQSVNFTTDAPASTGIRFQMASNNDDVTWNFTGPDGTGSTYYETSGEMAASSLGNNRYVRYKAYLETIDVTASPALRDMTVYYTKSASIEPIANMAGSEQAMYYLALSGSADWSVGNSQQITVTARDNQGAVLTSYAGDKNITLSGANTNGSDTPVFSDKNGNSVSFGSTGVLNFTDGLAVTSIILYKAETAQISASDNVSSAGSALSVTVVSTGGGLIAPPRPDTTLISVQVGPDGVMKFAGLPSDIIQVAISDTPDFREASFEDIENRIDISGYAGKKIYLIFRTRQGAVSEIVVYDSLEIKINEGDIVKTANSFDVYIIKYKGGKRFKRLILSPSVFSSYRHLKWENLKIISQSQMDDYITSNLAQVMGDPNLYELIPSGDTGKRRPVNLTEEYDSDSVYEINSVDRDSYLSVD